MLCCVVLCSFRTRYPFQVPLSYNSIPISNASSFNDDKASCCASAASMARIELPFLNAMLKFFDPLSSSSTELKELINVLLVAVRIFIMFFLVVVGLIATVPKGLRS